MRNDAAWTDRIDPSDLAPPAGTGGNGRMAHYLLFLTAAAVVAFFAWARIAPLQELASGKGAVVPSGLTKAVSHADGGTLAELAVADGEIVESGQLLLRITDPENDAALVRHRQALLHAAAAAERADAEAEGLDSVRFSDDLIARAPEAVEAERLRFEARREGLDRQVAALATQLEEHRQRADDLAERLSQLGPPRDLVRQEYELLKPLVDRGAAPRIDLTRIEQKLKDLDAQIAGADERLRSARDAVGELENRIEQETASYRAAATADLSRLRAEIARLGEDIRSGEQRQRRAEVLAPVAGTVRNLTVPAPGKTVKPGRVLVEVVPLEDRIFVEARIRPIDLGHVRPGLDAVVRLDAFDGPASAGLSAIVVDINPDLVTAEEGEAFYRVRVQTERAPADRDLTVVPGMLASVDIVTGQKTVLDYILDPVVRARGKALSER